MNEQYQYCMKCGATHPVGYKHKEPWLSDILAGIACIIIIALIFAFIIMFAGQGPK